MEFLHRVTKCNMGMRVNVRNKTTSNTSEQEPMGSWSEALRVGPVMRHSTYWNMKK